MKRNLQFAIVIFFTMAALFAQKTTETTDAIIDSQVLNEYHAQQIQALKILKDAQVKAGIITQKQADAAITFLKAQQTECNGECILQHRKNFSQNTTHRAAPMYHSHKNFAHHNNVWNDRPHVKSSAHKTLPNSRCNQKRYDCTNDRALKSDAQSKNGPPNFNARPNLQKGCYGHKNPHCNGRNHRRF